MKLKEWVTILEADDSEPLGVLMGIIQIMRSGYHGRPATKSELYASCERWIEILGVPTTESIHKWMADSPTLFDLDVPDSIVLMAVSEKEEKI